MKQKYVRLNENKSNIESVVLSFLPTIKKIIKRLEIEENEDLVQECLVNIIEYLNRNANTNLNNIYPIIYITIYKYIFSFFGFFGIKGRFSFNYLKMREIIEAINFQDKEAINSLFGSKGSDYLLMEQVPFEDYYDESDILLETKIINESYVKGLLEYLAPREREIIMLYYGFYNNVRYTTNEIADIYNVSQPNISQIKKRALEKLAIYNSKMENNLKVSERSKAL